MASSLQQGVSTAAGTVTSSMFSDDESALDGTSNRYSQDLQYALVAFSALTWYNAVEMLLLIFVVFKKYKGLYFWSLTITSISIIPYEIGAWLKLIFRRYNVAATVLLNTGWIIMIVGQSVVLYSRLHLVTQNRYILRGVRIMIATTAIVLCVPTTVTTYGSNVAKTHGFVSAYAVVEKFQMTCFTLQEFSISLIYLYRVHEVLKIVSHQRQRRILYELFVINIVIIVLDIVLLAIEYKNAYQVEIVLKGFIYSVKLKLELGVLSKLVRTVSGRDFQNGVLGAVGENFPLDGNKFHLGALATHINESRKYSTVADPQIDRKASALVSPAVLADISGRRPSTTAISPTITKTTSRRITDPPLPFNELEEPMADLPEHSSIDPEGPSAVLDKAETDSIVGLTLHGSRSSRTGASSPGMMDDYEQYPGRLA